MAPKFVRKPAPKRALPKQVIPPPAIQRPAKSDIKISSGGRGEPFKPSSSDTISIDSAGPSPELRPSSEPKAGISKDIMKPAPKKAPNNSEKLSSMLNSFNAARARHLEAAKAKAKPKAKPLAKKAVVAQINPDLSKSSQKDDSDDDWMGDAGPSRGRAKAQPKKQSASSNADDWLGDFEGARKRGTTKPECTSDAASASSSRQTNVEQAVRAAVSIGVLKPAQVIAGAQAAKRRKLEEMMQEKCQNHQRSAGRDRINRDTSSASSYYGGSSGSGQPSKTKSAWGSKLPAAAAKSGSQSGAGSKSKKQKNDSQDEMWAGLQQGFHSSVGDSVSASASAVTGDDSRHYNQKGGKDKGGKGKGKGKGKGRHQSPPPLPPPSNPDGSRKTPHEMFQEAKTRASNILSAEAGGRRAIASTGKAPAEISQNDSVADRLANKSKESLFERFTQFARGLGAVSQGSGGHQASTQMTIRERIQNLVSGGRQPQPQPPKGKKGKKRARAAGPAPSFVKATGADFDYEQDLDSPDIEIGDEGGQSWNEPDWQTDQSWQDGNSGNTNTTGFQKSANLQPTAFPSQTVGASGSNEPPHVMNVNPNMNPNMNQNVQNQAPGLPSVDELGKFVKLVARVKGFKGGGKGSFSHEKGSSSHEKGSSSHEKGSSSREKELTEEEKRQQIDQMVAMMKENPKLIS
jgi:hypothetical protein